jgi:hypothetical protein
MSKIFIRNHIRDLINNSNSELIHNIMNYLNLNNYSGKGIITKTSHKIILKEQIGGEKKLINIQNNTFEYHIQKISFDDNKKRLCFLNINETSDYCACLLYSSKSSGNTILRIEGIFNGSDCVKCKNPKYKFKVGNILMLIILKLINESSVFSHIKQIELSDTSQLNCNNFGLQLKYLKTITDGIPFYAKYGFRPLNSNDYDIFKFNRENYKLNKQLNNNQIFQIITEIKLEQNIYQIYEKYFFPYIDSTHIINPKIFLNDMIEFIKINNQNNLLTDTNKLICNFISKIYKKIFFILGYKDYDSNIWILNIKK